MQYGRTVLQGAGEDVRTSFEHNQLLSGDKGQRCVWDRFDMLDEIAVDQQGVSIQPGEFNHVKCVCSSYVIGRGEVGVSLKNVHKGR